MRKGYALTLVGLTALMMTAAVPRTNAAVSTPVTSQHQPRHNSKDQKTFKIGHTIYKIESPKPAASHLTRSQVTVDLHQMRTQTLRDVRSERAKNLSTPIKVSRKLNRLAAIRAEQVSRHFSHYSRNGRPMTSVDARSAKLPKGFQGSENIASSSLGNCTEVADPKTYHNHNGRDMANMSNNGMMNYDEFEHNGHRKNILSSGNTLIGVGASYSARKRTFYLVEDFGDQNVRSSEDVDRSTGKFPIHLKSNQHSCFQKAFRYARHLIITWTKDFKF